MVPQKQEKNQVLFSHPGYGYQPNRHPEIGMNGTDLAEN
jgi:hypothetical protein